MSHRSVRAARISAAAGLVVALTLASTSVAVASTRGHTRPAAPGAADCTLPFSQRVWHYAEQYTSTQAGTSHMGICPASMYYGWAGIDGQVTTPTTASTADPATGEHNVGWIGTGFSSGGWLQVGWLAGVVGAPQVPDGQCSSYGTLCAQAPKGTYAMYIEWSADGKTFDTSHYYVKNVGAITGPVTYRIERVSTGCWRVYVNYNTQVYSRCSLPNSGEAIAVNELYNPYGTLKMGASDFGVSALNTNQTLRIKSGSGWVNWTTSNTYRIDESAFVHGPVLQTLQSYWYFHTYQS